MNGIAPSRTAAGSNVLPPTSVCAAAGSPLSPALSPKHLGERGSETAGAGVHGSGWREVSDVGGPAHDRTTNEEAPRGLRGFS